MKQEVVVCREGPLDGKLVSVAHGHKFAFLTEAAHVALFMIDEKSDDPMIIHEYALTQDVSGTFYRYLGAA